MSNYLDDILYVNLHYPRKRGNGIGFVVFWILLYLVATAAVCAYMWVSR